MKSNLNLTVLTLAGVSLLGAMPPQWSHADASSEGPLQVKMSLDSADKVAPGEPVLVHYSVMNTSSFEAATLLVGDAGNGWYSIKSLDAGGHTLRTTIRPYIQAYKQEGLYQPAERTLLPGEKIEGEIVASDFLRTAKPGPYSLQVNVALDYAMKPMNSDGSLSEVTDRFTSSKGFAFATTITASNPELVRAKAEALRQQLVRSGDAGGSKTVSKELFAMPETIALPTWQSLVADPKSNDFVRGEAAEQLSLHPSRATADLLAQILWNTDRDADIRSPSQTANLWTAMSKLSHTASPDLKSYIRSLYTANGVPASEVDHSAVKSHPN